MKIALIILNFILLSACVPSKVVEPKATVGKINVEAPYMWSSSAFPTTLLISDQFDTDEVANIQEMSAAWDTAVENKKEFIKHGSSKTAEVSSPDLSLDKLGDDGVIGIYKITNWPNSLPGSALAVTQIFGRRFNTGSSNEYVRIEHADILINNHLYVFRTGNTYVSGTFDFRTVLLHEMGHFLGMPHKSGSTVMVSTIGESTKNQIPTNIDRADLASKYNITLGSGGGSSMVAARENYSPNQGDTGQKIKILIELMADGECVHKVDGAISKRHPVHF
jgi:hypothetical protein